MTRETTPFDFSKTVVGLHAGGRAELTESAPGPPQRIDGYTVGAPFMSQPAPHLGEMHPDGDELLFVVSGRVSVLLEEGGTQQERGTERAVELRPGQALVVPRGVWHRVVPEEPSQLVHITPGPGDGHRPLTEQQTPFSPGP